MTRRPQSIIWSAILFLLTPFLYVAFRYTESYFLKNSTVTFSWLQTAAMVGSLFVSLGIWRVRSWGYYSFLVYSVIFVTLILKTYLMAPETQNYVAVLTAAGLSFFVALFLQKHTSAPYFNPKIRWWETAPRIQAELSAHFKIDGNNCPMEILDLSRSGAFVKLADPLALAAGDIVVTHVGHLDISLDIMSRVVRRDDKKNGFGLMFLEMQRNDKNELQRLISYLEDQDVGNNHHDEQAPKNSAQAA